MIKKNILKSLTACCACIALLATMLMAGCGTETTLESIPETPETTQESDTSASAETDDTNESDETAQTETDADAPKEMVSVTLNEVAHSIFTLQESKLSSNVKTLRGMRLVRSGNFLVAREPDDSFEWSKLVGKDVLGGRAGG